MENDITNSKRQAEDDFFLVSLMSWKMVARARRKTILLGLIHDMEHGGKKREERRLYTLTMRENC
jgi:hypothetical protein